MVYKFDDPNSIRVNDDFFSNSTYAFTLAKKSLTQSFEKKKIKKGLIDSLMLRFLLHLAGDIHQPLHCASLYSKHLFQGSIKNGDKGGNFIHIHDPITKQKSNLHAFWDSCLGLYSVRFKLPLKKEDLDRITKEA